MFINISCFIHTFHSFFLCF